jgi:hypothetical protein
MTLPRTGDYQEAMKLLNVFLALLFKNTNLSYSFVTDPMLVDETLPTAESINWNSKIEQPSIDIWLWEKENPKHRIRIRFCLVWATTKSGNSDIFNGRPDHPIPNEINSLEEMYEYMRQLDFHFCVVTLKGKNPRWPARFAAERNDKIPMDKYVARNKYDATRARKNHLYTKGGALDHLLHPVGFENKTLLSHLRELIHTQYQKNENNKR